MGRRITYEACPKCRERGQDSRGDNLVLFDGTGAHCFSCGYHRFGRLHTFRSPINVDENKAVLPNDFSREVPARAWKWLLQYGLPYSYWKPFVGWSEQHSRLIFTVGTPTRFSIGRYIEGLVVERYGVGTDRNGVGRPTGDVQKLLEKRIPERPPRKWHIFGDRGTHVELLGRGNEGPVVLVEDLISGHKVAQVATSIPMFGTKVLDSTLRTLITLKRPVVLWLDEDQYTLLAPKLNRLQTFLEVPVRYLRTDKDPKSYSVEEIKEIVK